MAENASVCRREINSEMGGATTYLVRLPDGFLIDCGSSGYAAQRARTLVALINDGPDRLTQEGMASDIPF